MSISATVPQRRCTSALIRRKLRGSGAASYLVSAMAPDARSVMSSQSRDGIVVSSCAKAAVISSRRSSMKTVGSSGMRSSR